MGECKPFALISHAVTLFFSMCFLGLIDADELDRYEVWIIMCIVDVNVLLGTINYCEATNFEDVFICFHLWYRLITLASFVLAIYGFALGTNCESSVCGGIIIFSVVLLLMVFFSISSCCSNMRDDNNVLPEDILPSFVVQSAREPVQVDDPRPVVIPGHPGGIRPPEPPPPPISIIPIIRKLFNKSEWEDKHTSCSVCLGSYRENEELVELECRHEFHEDCAKQWVDRCAHIGTGEPTCPICRRILDEQPQP